MVQSYQIHRELHKHLNFYDKFDNEGQGQGHHVSKKSEISRLSMNSLSVKTKFQTGQFKSLQQIFC